MDWIAVVKQRKGIKEEFDKLYKCLNIDRPISNFIHYERHTQTDKADAEKFLLDIREKLLSISNRRGIKLQQTLIHKKGRKPREVLRRSIYFIFISPENTAPSMSLIL